MPHPKTGRGEQCNQRCACMRACVWSHEHTPPAPTHPRSRLRHCCPQTAPRARRAGRRTPCVIENCLGGEGPAAGGGACALQCAVARARALQCADACARAFQCAVPRARAHLAHPPNHHHTIQPALLACLSSSASRSSTTQGRATRLSRVSWNDTPPCRSNISVVAAAPRSNTLPAKMPCSSATHRVRCRQQQQKQQQWEQQERGAESWVRDCAAGRVWTRGAGMQPTAWPPQRPASL